MPKAETDTDEDTLNEKALKDEHAELKDGLEPNDENIEQGEKTDDEDEASGEAEDQEALDELEVEELGMLTEDKASERLFLDEAAELRAIRQAVLALGASGEERAEDEFLCQSCFLLKKFSQLANRRRQLCNDCA